MHNGISDAAAGSGISTSTQVAKKVRTSERPRRFALLDTRPLRREGLACWLRAVKPRCVVSTFRDIDELLCGLGSGGAFDLALFSVCGAGFPEVLHALDKLIGMSFAVPSVVISDREDLTSALEFIRRGARGFMPTSLDLTIASAAVDFIVAGGTFLPVSLFLNDDNLAALRAVPRAGMSVVDLDDIQDETAETGDSENAAVYPPPASSEGSHLTSREAKVLECLRRGKPNKLIAHELALCESTVKMYVGRLMRKFKAANRTEVALLADKLLKGARDAKAEGKADAAQPVRRLPQPLQLWEPPPNSQIWQSTRAE
jgi:DNA-binding NarL/FixJ family response regulator